MRERFPKGSHFNRKGESPDAADAASTNQPGAFPLVVEEANRTTRGGSPDDDHEDLGLPSAVRVSRRRASFAYRLGSMMLEVELEAPSRVTRGNRHPGAIPVPGNLAIRRAAAVGAPFRAFALGRFLGWFFRIATSRRGGGHGCRFECLALLVRYTSYEVRYSAVILQLSCALKARAVDRATGRPVGALSAATFGQTPLHQQPPFDKGRPT